MIHVIALSALLWQAQPQQQPPGESPAYEGEWLVEVVDNIKVLPESRVTIVIRGNSVSGTAACNTYRGALTVNDAGVRVGQLLRTMKSCDSARMSEEADFFSTLGRVTTLEVRGKDTLVLSTSDGRTITARRQSSTARR